MQDIKNLSVIIPVYNVDKYVDRCINSVLMQSYRVDEIICVDDGSTDGSLDILNKYHKIDARVQVIHKKNGGLVSARKAGLAKSSGRYIAYLDSDDWIEKNMYAEMMKAIEDNDWTDLVTSGCIKDYPGMHSAWENEHIEAGVYDGERLVEVILKNVIDTEQFFRTNLSIRPINKIYRRELLLKYQNKLDDRINMMEGSGFAYPCILNARKIIVMGKNYYHYCMRENSITGTVRIDEKERYKILFKYLYGELESLGGRIPNILMQLKFLEAYAWLVQYPEEIIKYENEILFPYGIVKQNQKIVVYGSGNFGKRFIKALQKIEQIEVVALVDKKVSKGVISVGELKQIEFDKILIAVGMSDINEQIRQELINNQIEKTKIYTIDAELIKRTNILKNGDAYCDQ